MVDLICSRYRASDRGMAQDPFEEELGPRFAVEFGGPFREWLRAHPAEQITAPEWPVDDHRYLALLRQGQNALFRLPLHNRVIDLEKIEFFAAQDFLYLSEGGGIVMRYAKVAEAPLAFPIPHGGELSRDIDQIVNLHQIDSLGLQSRQRAFHRFDAFRSAPSPNFGGEKQFVVQPDVGGEGAGTL